MENVERNLHLFRELISCAHELYFWTYDARGNCVYSNNPNEQLFKQIFVLDKGHEIVQTENLRKDRPVILTSVLGFLWITDFEPDASGELLYTHVIGPAFIEDVSSRTIEGALNKLCFSLALKKDFLQLIQQIPVISMMRCFEYGLMLHYCIHGQKLTISDLQYFQAGEQQRTDHASHADAHGTWAMEQKLLRLIEEGNLNYKEQAGHMVGTGMIGNLGNGDSIRHIKNITIVYTALCTRAAIRGGVDSEIAYTLSDQYINAIETCASLSEIAEVNAAMQEDFVRRVHQIKKQDGISPQVRKCCDYIQLHVERRVSLTELAEFSGYSGTYLSRKFKQELGMTVGEYIMLQKIERAKILLRAGKQSIQEIAEQLGIQSQSYFGQQFKKVTGMTPGEYRLKSDVEAAASMREDFI